MPSLLAPNLIRTDQHTQMRIALNEEAVKEYAAVMEAGQVFPAILVFYDEPNNLYILADGFHRYTAHMRVKPNDPILVELRLGTVEDARWESIGSNKSHGLRRTNEDKRNATTQALLFLDHKGKEISNPFVADHVGVGITTVRNIRHELESTWQIAKSTIRTGKDGRTIDTSKIGSSKSSTPPPGSTCAICHYFEKSTCQRDDSQPLPWTAACEHFKEKDEEQSDQAGTAQNKTSENTQGEKPKKQRSKNPNQYERTKGCETLLLPPDNPQLFAVELRNRFDPEYLIACMGALRHLLMDKGD